MLLVLRAITRDLRRIARYHPGWLLIAASVLLNVAAVVEGPRVYQAGYTAALRRAEATIAPHGVVIQQEDGTCRAYLGQAVSLTFPKPMNAQFVAFFWPRPGTGSAK